MAVATNIYIFDDSLTPEPVNGVVVNVYNSTTFALVASATSNSAGRAAFSLPGSTSPGTTYEVRLFKLGVIFSNPLFIQVIEPVVSNNDFNVTGILLTLETATDPRCCRCTGRFLDYSNRPVPNILVRILAQAITNGQIPKIVDGNLISPEAMNLRTDENGFIKVDLLQGAKYWIMFSGEDDNVVQITIPTRSSINLIDVMYPQPVLFEWDQAAAPGNTISLATNTQTLINGALTFSDYSVITSGFSSWLVFTSSDDSVANLGSNDTGLNICTLSPGITTISVAASPLLPSRVPANALVAPSLTVMVS